VINNNIVYKKCRFCKKDIKANEYDDHILCHTLNNDHVENSNSGTGMQTIVTSSGNRYKVVYSVNVSRGANRNTRQNRIEITNPTITISQSNHGNALRSLQNLANISNMLRQINTNMIREVTNNPSEGILDMLPETTLDNVSKLPEEKRSCVICISNFDNGDKVLTIPCYHLFHTTCLKNWFKTNNTCPICKFKIDNNSLNI